MRQIEFEQLVLGDVIYNPGREDEPWTVVAPSKKHESFLIVSGRYNLTEKTRRLWLAMAMLPDRLCLDIADSLDLRVGLIFDYSKWEKEKTPS